eukprot:1151319-Pelagomonas_calceolata.AAC.2
MKQARLPQTTGPSSRLATGLRGRRSPSLWRLVALSACKPEHSLTRNSTETTSVLRARRRGPWPMAHGQ